MVAGALVAGGLVAGGLVAGALVGGGVVGAAYSQVSVLCHNIPSLQLTTKTQCAPSHSSTATDTVQ